MKAGIWRQVICFSTNSWTAAKIPQAHRGLSAFRNRYKRNMFCHFSFFKRFILPFSGEKTRFTTSISAAVKFKSTSTSSYHTSILEEPCTIVGSVPTAQDPSGTFLVTQKRVAILCERNTDLGLYGFKTSTLNWAWKQTGSQQSYWNIGVMIIPTQTAPDEWGDHIQYHLCNMYEPYNWLQSEEQSLWKPLVWGQPHVWGKIWSSDFLRPWEGRMPATILSTLKSHFKAYLFQDALDPVVFLNWCGCCMFWLFYCCLLPSSLSYSFVDSKAGSSLEKGSVIWSSVKNMYTNGAILLLLAGRIKSWISTCT